MNNRSFNILATVLFLWTGAIFALFLQVAGLFEFKLLQFPVAKGNLIFFKNTKRIIFWRKGKL